MSKKMYTMLSSIVGSVAAIASAIVTYCQPASATAIVASIGIGSTAIIEIMNQFQKEN